VASPLRPARPVTSHAADPTVSRRAGDPAVPPDPIRRRRWYARAALATLVVAASLLSATSCSFKTHHASGQGGGVFLSPSASVTISFPPSASASASPSRSPSASSSSSTASHPPAHTPLISRVATNDRVAFITIDDGWIRRPEAIELLRTTHVPVTLFLTIDAVKSDVDYFRQLQAAGAVIEDHTISHPNMVGMSYAAQKQQICGAADQFGQWYARRPIFFRPPYGNRDATTLQAAHDCGMHAVFLWRETVDKGIVRYQIGHSVQPGDIILMHFRDAFVADFTAAVNAIHAAGLQPALLENYVH
jgi:peptidoglycan/xylan/chitin deacetylase (PgdA/CDA1 family)